jgi:hypothetical protein
MLDLKGTWYPYEIHISDNFIKPKPLFLKKRGEESITKLHVKVLIFNHKYAFFNFDSPVDDM